MTVLSEDTLLLLDFDHEIKCSSPFDCDNRAEWVCRIRCCGSTTLACTPCITEGRKNWNSNFRLLYCAKCGHMAFSGAFDKWYEITKL